MAEAIPPPNAIEVLKSLNNAVHSRRIFPFGSPQIKSADDRTLSLLRLYLTVSPLFALALSDGKPAFVGHPISQEIFDAIPNLSLYRQLQLLQQPQLCVRAGFDEAELLSLFNLLAAKVEEIRKGGGGSEFIRAHGLEKFFPTADIAAELTQAAPENSGTPRKDGHFLDRMPVKPEYLDYLLDKNNSARRATQIRELLRQPEEGGKLLAGCLATVLNELLSKRQLRESHFFTTILSRCLTLAPEGEQGEVLKAAAAVLVEFLPVRALAICLVQDDKLVAGARLRDHVLSLTSLDIFGEVIALLRGRLEKLARQRGDDDGEARRLGQTLDTLLASGRGKQYLGREKAKSLLASGELERRKKRVQAGLAALWRGDLTLLDSEEMLSVLPWIVRKLVSEGRQRDVAGLLHRIASRIEQRDHPVLPALGHCLVEVVDDFRREKQGDLLVQAIKPLLGCLMVLQDGPVCASVARALNRLMQICWKSGQMALGDSILRRFALIRGGKIIKPARVTRGIIQEVDNGVSKEMLEHFLEECLANPGDAATDSRLVMQGPVAGRFLIERLMRAEKASERLRIIDLLSGGLPYLPGIVLEKLAEPMPWYGKRNLLKLLAENGDVSHIEPVFAFLSHDDLRVQREAFVCLYKLSGRQQRRDTLLRVLTMASEGIRLQAVRALLPYADETVLAAARQIIDEREAYSPAVRDDLLIGVCQLLARCPPGDSITVLNDFIGLRDRKSGRGVGEAVWREAESALKQQRKNLVNHKKHLTQAVGQRKMALRHLSKTTQALPSAKLAFTGADERAITRLLAAGDAEDAGRVFLEAITRLTQQADVAQAQRLRQWFGERQPDNLHVMIKAGELIAAAGAASVEKSHLEVWADFYDSLSTEEFTAFYQALSHRDYQDEEIIARQGEALNSLYMINSGRVKIIHHNSDGADVLLQTLVSGELLGTGNFLGAATWPATAVSVGLTNLSRLDLGCLAAWDEDKPELEQKLRAFCARFTCVDEAFRKSGQERRRSTRYTAQAHVGMRLLDNAGVNLGVGQDGELIDVSDQGLSLKMRLTSRRNARQLLGRDATFSVATAAETLPTLVTGGKIVAVRELQKSDDQAEVENTLHISLHEPLGERRLMEILKLRDKLKSIK